MWFVSDRGLEGKGWAKVGGEGARPLHLYNVKGRVEIEEKN